MLDRSGEASQVDNPGDDLCHPAAFGVSRCIWEAVRILGLSIKYVIAGTSAESGYICLICTPIGRVVRQN